MNDPYGRKIDYLRISITDRCNLRCIYCMPSKGVKPLRHRDILSYDEIIRIVKVAAPIGIRKVRITGGEPLARKGVTGLISSLRKIDGIENLSLTTNGILLEKMAEELAEAGLDRVNVSIDSLKPEKYKEITRGGFLDAVLNGVKKAESVGLKPVKFNMVPIRGFNDDEIEDFARLTLNNNYQIRFIEFMPIGAGEKWTPEKHISIDEIRPIVEKVGRLTPVKLRKFGPARYFRFDGAPGVIGFINAVTHMFCKDCNRLRLTSDGNLRSCLFSDTEVDLKTPLRSGASDSEIKKLFQHAIETKPEKHNISCRDGSAFLRPMSGIGG
jgi:cyclic pyranopterin phosphate synthase